MKYLIILILFCSCSTTLKVNGVEVKHRNKIPNNEKQILLASFLFGYVVTPMIFYK